MAENFLTPASPSETHQQDNVRTSYLDITLQSDSDDGELSPEERLHRMIAGHEKEFKDKLSNLANLTNSIISDHAKSIKQLRKTVAIFAKQARNERHQRSTTRQPLQLTTRLSQAVRQSIGPRLSISTPVPATFRTAVSNPMPTTLQSIEPKHEVEPDEPIRNNDRRKIITLHVRPQDAPVPSAPIVQSLSTAPDHVERENTSESQTGDEDGAFDGDIVHEDYTSNIGMDAQQPQHDYHSNLEPQVSFTGHSLLPLQKVRETKATTAAPPKTPSSTSRALRIWTPDEVNDMIEIIGNLHQQDWASKNDMWKRASELHYGRGHSRTKEQMAAKWSFSTRHTCADRGLTWAEDVMEKLPHIPRKRKAGDDGTQATTIPKFKRAKRGIKRKPVTVTHSEELVAPCFRQNLVTMPTGTSTYATNADQLQLRWTFHCASSDIVKVDWSPDSNHFIAASTSLVDERDSYVRNAPRNLIHGSLLTRTLRDLPDHRIERQDSLRQYLYQTVSAVHYSTNGHVYSGGYDGMVRVWNVEDETRIKCRAEIKSRRKRIEVMDVTGSDNIMLASGCSSGTKCIRVIAGDAELSNHQKFYPIEEAGATTFQFSPTCMKFGRSSTQNWLVAGFGRDAENTNFGAGCISVWKFHEATYTKMRFDEVKTFVSDCTWSSTGSTFAIAYVNEEARSGEHSMVNLYDSHDQKRWMKINCAAKDINEVTLRKHYVTASCTDGATYVWDSRNPSKLLHTLPHGDPLISLSSIENRELEDVGVRYIEWTDKTGQLYTGGSDGVVKLWDIDRAPQDVLVQNVAEIGEDILCGKISPDSQSLLLGDDSGRLHLFGKGANKLPDEASSWRFEEAT
jgi:WD40 repeat protein